MRLVTVSAPGLRTPRMVMQWCSASMTTATPLGWSTRWMASATWTVSFSWIWSRREYRSTTRASLLSPTTRLSGR